MKKIKQPEVITLSEEQIKNLQKNIEDSNLTTEQKNLVVKLLSAYLWLAGLFRLKKLSLNKLKRLFAFNSEKTPDTNTDKDKKKDNDGKGSGPKGGGGSGKDSNGDTPKGHGRNGKKDFSGANKILHPHEALTSGDLCPSCEIGKVYPVDPGIFIQFVGQSPIQCTLHELEKFRCNACGDVFTAKLPKEIQERKYDYSADVTIAMQKYGLGIPFYRSDQWQKAMKVPIPSSTQWERVENLGDSVYPVFDKLIELAAEGRLSYVDDTTGRIINLKKEIQKTERKGIFTTGIVSLLNDHVIHLYFTGNKHAGENMDRLLEKRKSIDIMMVMSDALSRNKAKKVLTLWCKCLTHARRLFFDEKENYPKMVASLLHLFGKVYHFDEICRQKNLSPEERLKYHQKHSAPIMAKIRKWCLRMLFLKKVEPNDNMGHAMKYLFEHWKELTQFLKVPGAPICNNTAERALKLCILHRKNSLFFKTTFGAYIGDMMMSLIKTCHANAVNVFDYLVTLHKNKSLVKQTPEKWLPWNYQMIGQI